MIPFKRKSGGWFSGRTTATLLVTAAGWGLAGAGSGAGVETDGLDAAEAFVVVASVEGIGCDEFVGAVPGALTPPSFVNTDPLYVIEFIALPLETPAYTRSICFEFEPVVWVHESCVDPHPPPSFALDALSKVIV